MTPDSIFNTLKKRIEKRNISNFAPTAVALQGAANLIESGLTLGKIKVLTGFETQKIAGSNQFYIMMSLLNEGAITIDDLENFCDDLKNIIIHF